MARIIDKYNEYVANLGKVDTDNDSTMVSRKKKGWKNKLRRKLARAQRRRNRNQ